MQKESSKYRRNLSSEFRLGNPTRGSGRRKFYVVLVSGRPKIGKLIILLPRRPDPDSENPTRGGRSGSGFGNPDIGLGSSAARSVRARIESN